MQPYSASVLVGHILAARTAFGTAPLSRNLSFSKDGTVRARFCDHVQSILEAIDKAGITLTEAMITGLIVKTALYCVKRGWQRPASINELQRECSRIADAVIARPDALLEPVGLAGLLSAHDTRAFQAAASAPLPLPSEPPVLVLQSATRFVYTLVELTAPEHLRTESAYLRHCAGVIHNERILEQLGISRTSREADEYLVYARKIRQRRARILSFRSRGRPCATIEYNTEKQAITQIEGRRRHIPASAPFFSGLCELLHAFTQTTTVLRIDGMPYPPVGTVFTSEGTPQSFTPSLIADTLIGYVAIDAETPQSVVDALAGSPRFTLDITNLPLASLPSHVAANLITRADVFEATNLESAAHIDAMRCRRLSVPKLRQSLDINAPRAVTLSAPCLADARDILCPEARHCDLSSLRTIADLLTPKATTLLIPELAVAREIDTGPVEVLDAPSLVYARHIRSSARQSFEAPQLREATSIALYRATELKAPRLGAIAALRATNLSKDAIAALNAACRQALKTERPTLTLFKRS